VILLTVACGARNGSNSSATGSLSTTSGPTTAPAQPGAKSITIENFSYQTPAAVQPGAQITVNNKDSVEHTVTADSGGAFNIEVGANSQVTFTAPAQWGSYPFHCTYHANMRGGLVVVHQD
jgi:plastocyanin